MKKVGRLFVPNKEIVLTRIFLSSIHFSPGENAEGGKGLRQQAGEIMACKLKLIVIEEEVDPYLCFFPSPKKSPAMPFFS